MLDTRHKILTSSEALARGIRGSVFLAYFDVLTAPLVRRLHEIEGPVTVVLLDPPAPLLSRQARAELAASLAHVETVVLPAGETDTFLQDLNPDKIIHWEGQDSARTAQLIEHVKTRYRSE